MEIYLIRHGHCYNSTKEHYNNEKQTMDPPLTLTGVEQANKLAKRLRDITFDKIYCSDLVRAMQTAEILQTTVKSELSVTPSFREIDMGEVYKNSWKAFPEIYENWLLHEEDIPYPCGECGMDVWNRCKKEMDVILEANYNRIAIVTHGGTIRSIICGVLGIPQQKRFNFGFPPENCSISIILQNDKSFCLHTFNDFYHLLSN
ncbi:MAG: histidine phosphatase family protein [Clostridiaceae bacterium]|nr:histidine phosphatase family protein [Clostridiaceae bacterium]